MKRGTIIPNGMVPTPHEYRTILALTEDGQTVELLRPSQTKYVRTADIVMLGMEWEIKSPTGKSRSTMEHIFQKGAKQAHNLIIDLRRTKIHDDQAITTLQKLFERSRSVRNLWLITKGDQLIKLKK